MKLLPYDTFQIETSMSADAIVTVLDNMIEPTKWLRLSKDHKTFQGSIDRDGFTIYRIIHYRNSFSPVIRGRFYAGASGTTVTVTMRLQSFVTIFMCVWFGGVGVGIIAVLAGLTSGQTKADPMLLIPFVMLLLGWALVSGGFWFEALKNKSILVEMFSDQVNRQVRGVQQ